jgi:hypothetical protein
MTKEITIFYVGNTADEAILGLPFDSYESAESFQLDNPGMLIYSATAVVDFSTVELCYD